MILYDYDNTDPISIKRQALKVLHKTLREVLPGECISSLSLLEEKFNARRKGFFGDLVEKYIFDKKSDSSPLPDFPKAGVELKTTPIKKHSKNFYCAKERLVFGMINYENIIKERWKTSTFLKKNSLLLLMLYLYKKDVSLLDYRFKLIKLLDFFNYLSAEDLKIIKKDWQTIVEKIKKGKAHELSEGDTFYLGACTKGATAEKSKRKQPNSKILAPSRAFSLKPKYMNFLISENLASIKKDHATIIKPGSKKSIEEIVKEKLSPFIGLTTVQIEKSLGKSLNKEAKGCHAALARAMLGAKKKKITEFEKANVTMKIIRLTKIGRPEESMSFPAMDYMSIVKEKWETSTFRDMISSKKFLFVIYQYNKTKDLVFKKYMFWNIPYQDLESHVKKVWIKTVSRIKQKHADDLPKMAFNHVCHVRPHGQNSHDKAPTHYGDYVKKQGFWLSAKYLRTQISK